MNRRKSAKHSEKRKFYPLEKKYRIALLVMGVVMICCLVAMILMDALPGDLTLALTAIMLGLIAVSSILFASKSKKKRVLGIVVALIFTILFSFITGFMGNTYAMLAKMSDTGTEASGPIAKSVDVTSEPFNIYITGIDQWAYEKGMDLERSDVNMIITVNPVTKKILLTSIPRDTYVELHTAKQMDKLTHTGIYGVDETINTVQDWLDLDMNYYVKLNFTGVMMIITAMGGIDVYSPIAFESSISKYSYEKGWNHLYGKPALYFARERKAFEGQDAMRVENQQRVVEAVIKKMTSSPSMLLSYGEIMDTAGEQIQTNLSQNEMSTLAKMQITDLASWDIESQKIEGEVDQDYVASLTQAQKFDIYRPSEASVRSCVNRIKEVMNPTQEELNKATHGRTRSFFVNAIKRIISKEKQNNEE